MAKSKLRRLKIRDDRFLWTVKALYLPHTDVAAEYTVHVKFTAFIESYKTTALHIHFKTSATVAGNWLTSGIGEINLHLPSFARLLIVGGMEQGWQAQRQTLTIEDGLTILRRAGYSIKDE